MKLLHKLILLGVFLVGITACSDKSNVKIIKLGHGLDISHPVHKSMVYMSEQLSKKSHGKLRIQIYPNQQLGTERELVELLQIGSLGITKVSASVLENFAPSYSVLSIPFIFDSDQHRFNVLEGEVGKEILNDGVDYWFQGLCFYDAGSRSFYTKDKPIKTPDDLKGLKIRVMESQTAMDMVHALGGSPTPISFGELYTALQQGVVDGAENNPPSFYSSRHYEVCKYYTIDEHSSVPDVLIISTHVWNRLSKQEKEWVQAAANESAIYQKQLWKQASDEAMEKVKEAGVEIIYPDKRLFQKKVEKMYDAYRKDPLMKRLMGQIQKNRAVMDHFIKGLNKILETILTLIMAILIIDVLWQVVSRFILSDPSPFTDELARFLLIWISLLGGAYVLGKRLHLSIDLISRKLTLRISLWLDSLVQIILLVFIFTVLIVGGTRLMFITLFLEQTSAALKLPLGFVYSILPLSGSIMAIYCIHFLIDNVKKLKQMDSETQNKPANRN
jgi:tripartite ATP-independent transporter DctP family solute receptor